MRAIELQNFGTLSVILDQVRLNVELEDLRIWMPDSSGGFSCKSALAALQHEDGLPDFQFHKFIWILTIPVKIRFFAWPLCLERIKTYDVLQRKRLSMCLYPNWRVLCKKDEESICHLFLQCNFARSLWFKVFREFGVISEVLNNFLDLLKGCSNARWTKTIKALWVCVVWAILWGIWREKFKNF